MKVHLYTDEEIKILKSNKYVLKVKYKREIEYDPLFKLWAIMMRLDCPELSAKEIFELGGFNTEILNSGLPQRRIRYWYLKYKKYGVNYFIENTPYSNINKIDITKIKKDDFKNYFMKYIIKRLEEIENGREAY